jgi:glutamine synthetase
MTIHSARTEALTAHHTRPARSVEYPVNPTTRKPVALSEIFGSNVFGRKQLQDTLPKPVYSEFAKQLAGGRSMTKQIADAVAHAVRVWAMERGATHFTHWFQPLNDSTAEKQDSFLSMNYISTPNGIDVSYITVFNTRWYQLMLFQEVNSFRVNLMLPAFLMVDLVQHLKLVDILSGIPLGKYLNYVSCSPMYIQEGPHGTAILYIPSVFISYNGDALDEKTVLLRSTETLNTAAVDLLHLIGETDVKRVFVTLGTEQEFFLLDRLVFMLQLMLRGAYALRPDLRMSGRTLLGQIPPKHQQLEDHYFGKMPSRVLAAISEAELELWKNGVPVKTRHNEVAPAQFEMVRCTNKS